MAQHFSVIVVGGGQAGLSVSCLLKQRGIDHVVFERERIGHAWREKRWDTFCLVTPNWQCQLPGYPYAGDQPHGFMGKDDIVKYIEGFAASFEPPILEGVEVKRVRRGAHGGFDVETSAGDYSADQIVSAVGGYHVPSIPRVAERLPNGIVQVHSSDYKKPESLPAGAVLVVGTGQSGCQIAEDLHLAGRQVHLCVGSAPRVARRYRGKDVVEWLDEMGYYNLPVHEHPLKEGVRGRTNHYVTGRDGGRDIDLRKLAKEGMKLYGRLTDVRDGRLTFDGDLKKNLDKADEVSESIKTSIDQFIAKRGIAAPTEARYKPVWEPGEAVRELSIAKAGITSVIWSVGFRSDFRWLQVPVFDGQGAPVHTRGVTHVPGVYFIGLPWLYTWGSGRFSGVARDAGYLVDQIEARAKTGVGVVAQTEQLAEAALGS